MGVATVRIQVNGTWYNATLKSGNTWQATLTAPGQTSFNQSGGYYAVTAEATNTAGSKTTVTATDPVVGSSLRLVVKETVKPNITITFPSENAFLGESSVDITYQLRDEPGGSGIKIDTLSFKLDNTTYTSTSPGMTVTQVTNGYDCKFSAVNLSDGAHNVTINVKDNDGNSATATTRKFTTDTIPPVLDVTSPTQNLVTNQANQAVSGTTNDATSPSVTVKITLNGTDQGTISVGSDGKFSKTVTLVEGNNVIVVTATDTVNRITTITRNVMLDTTEPVFESITITPNPADAGETVIISAVIR